MLKDTFFSIIDTVDSENGRTCRLALHVAHPIFQAHFAGNPIMPGACVVQLIKEIASDYFNRAFFVCTVKNMKFLHPINPLESPEITAQLTFTQQESGGRIAVQTVLNREERVFSKSILILEDES